MASRFLLDGTEHAVWLSRSRAGGYRLHRPGGEKGVDVALEEAGGAPPRHGSASERILQVGGARIPVHFAQDGDTVLVQLEGRAYALRFLDPVASGAGDRSGAAGNEARAPMPGTVIGLPVRPGDEVAAGDALVVIESMKLETTLRAAAAGRVAAVHVAEGQSFERDQVLVTLAEAA